VAGLARAQHRHALALQAEAPARLGSLGNLDPGLAALDGRHVEATTQRRRHHGDWHAAVQIGTIALEECVRGKRQEDVEGARRAATRAGFAFSGKPDARAVLDARRNIDRQSPLARDAARSSTAGAGIVDHLAAALTVRAGPLESEKALGVADLALARA